AANITNFTVWFALTFWVFLETRSVFATGMIAGIYLALTAGLGFWFGSLVDHHRKKAVMLGSGAASLALYLAAFAVLRLTPAERMAEIAGLPLWLFIGLNMAGVIAGNARTIALPTVVTLLIAPERRDRANGLVGMATGVGFLTTSAISGFLVAWGGMTYALTFAVAVTGAAMLHLAWIMVDEPPPGAGTGAATQPRRVDIAGTVRVIAAVPGLIALILFSCFNNFLG